MKKIIFALAVLIAIPFSETNGQSDSNPPIIFKNHKVYPTSFNQKIPYAADEVVDGNIYRIIQQGDEKYFNLSDDFALEVLSYLPHNAFSVSIPINAIPGLVTTLEEIDGRIVNWEAEWKLSPRLFIQDIPSWAWLDNKHIKVWVQGFENISTPALANMVQAQKLEIIDSKPELNMVSIAIKPGEAVEIAKLPFVNYIQEEEDPGTPENYTARTNHRVNYLQAKYSGAPGYDGSGVTVGHGDDGAMGFHVDFTGRLTQSAPASNGDHGDHVAGTIFGAGNKDPKGRGMAPGAEVYYQDYPDNLNFVDQDFNQYNVRITSSSYSNGCNAGYTGFTRQMDMDMDDNPTLLHVFSAGNNGTSDCGYGAGSRWGNVTGGHKIAKNVVTVANLTSTDNIATSSSRGPSEDGRIKPDIAAVGTQVYSTTDLPAPHSYTSKTGTSMSCPGVSGTLATLYEAYRDVYTVDPHASLLKGILQNTAEDLGNPGPDFIYGYGRMNARRANEVIQNGYFMSDSITGTTKSFTVNMPSTGTVKEVRIMLIWPDPAASLAAGKVLVNDLDLTASQGSNNYQPWVLDPTPNASNLNTNAVATRDSLNNVEQITISNPTSGNITVDVDAFNLPSSGQKFFVTYEFVMDEVVLTYPVGGEQLVPGEIEYIRWDAPEAPGSFAVEYSTDNGSTWTSIINAGAAARTAIWPVPNQFTNEALVRITRGSSVSTSLGNFTIVDVPNDPVFASQCPDSATLAWNPVSGSDGYVVYELGAKYMDSIGFTTDTFYAMPVSRPTIDGWYSVAATTDSSAGRRAIAIQKPLTVFNCDLDDDILLEEMLSPQAGYINDCFDYAQSPIKVKITNKGNNAAFNFDVNYTINTQTVVTETVTDTIAPGASIDFAFSANSNITAGSNYYIDIWTSYPADENLYNDTISDVVIIVPGNTVSLPFSHNFENFFNCGTNSNCGSENCTLRDDWLNAPNFAMDDIDWRTNNGSTPTNTSGPSIDANPGTALGKYLYLEASGGCDSNEAILISPCIDLTDQTLSNPAASYQYHMNGVDMGKLDVDVITKDKTFRNVHPTISGNQGFLWKRQTIDLTPYIGEFIMLRFRGKTGDNFSSDVAIDDFQLYADGIGLEEQTVGNLTVYPNPNTGVFSVSLGEAYSGEISFSITSLAGKVVHQETDKAGKQSEFKLDISDLPKGAYILSVVTKAGTQNLNIIKE